MTHPAVSFFFPAAGYLLGSVPFAFLIGLLFKVDLRKVGSGNVGAGNLTRTVGLPAGAVAAVLDGFKGLVPVLFMKSQGVGPGVISVTGLAIVVGHNWSVFMRGRSGRGLAPSSGVLLAVAPALAVWPGGWAVAGWKFGGGVCGFLGWASLPVVAVLMHRPAHIVLAALGLSVLMIVRRIQGNPNHEPGVRAALHRAVFDTDPEIDLTGAEEPVGR